MDLSGNGPVIGYDCEDGGPPLPIAPIVSGKDTEMIDANAKLIASAPELLEALQRLHGILSQTVFYDSYPELIEPTESAIEKATN